MIVALLPLWNGGENNEKTLKLAIPKPVKSNAPELQKRTAEALSNGLAHNLANTSRTSEADEVHLGVRCHGLTDLYATLSREPRNLQSFISKQLVHKTNLAHRCHGRVHTLAGKDLLDQLCNRNGSQRRGRRALPDVCVTANE